MSTLLWGWAAVYVFGYLMLWQGVESEWLDPFDERREDATGLRMPRNALTPRGERRWRVARRFTLIGFGGWVIVVLVWFAGGIVADRW